MSQVYVLSFHTLKRFKKLPFYLNCCFPCYFIIVNDNEVVTLHTG